MRGDHRFTAALGAPARFLIIGGIKVYRATLSGWLGGQCRFYPTCSAYGEQAVRTHGAIKGAAMALWRIARCNPFGAGGIDPVAQPGPTPDAMRAEYDVVIHRRKVRG